MGASPPGDVAVAALTPWVVEFRYGEAPEDDLARAATLALLEDLREWTLATFD